MPSLEELFGIGTEHVDDFPPPFASAVVYKNDSLNKVIAKKWNDNLGRWQRIAQGKADVDDASVVQSALNSLTPGRTWKETVKLIGEFTVCSSIAIPDYTTLDLSEARLTLASNVNDHMFKEQTDSATCICIIGGELNGNKANQSGSVGISRGISLSGATKCNILNVEVHDFKGYGILLHSNPFYCKIIGCNAYGNDLSGIAPSTASNCIIAFNQSTNNGGDGIDNYRPQNCKYIANMCYNNNGLGIGIYSSAKNNEIIANTCHSNGQDGIRLTAFEEVADFAPKQNKLIANACYNNEWNGIQLMGGDDNIIDGNICYNNGQGSTGMAGIKIIDDLRGTKVFDALRVVITQNTCFDNQTTKTQEYGIVVNNPNGGVVYVVELAHNVVVGNKTAAISYALGTVYTKSMRHNYGYQTENYGTASITGDGVTTTFNIPHGLVSTPSYVNVQPKAGAPEPSSIDWDSTNIVLTFATAPTAGTYYYAWEAKV